MLLHFLFIVLSLASCYKKYDGNVTTLNWGYYDNNDNNCHFVGSGWKYERNDGKKKYYFTFSNCCENSGKMYIQLNENEYKNYVDFEQGSTLENLEIKYIDSNDQKYKNQTFRFYLRNYSSLLTLVIEKYYIYEDSPERLDVYDRPVEIETKNKAKYKIKYKTENRPYIYFFHDSTVTNYTIEFDEEGVLNEGCWYAFNTAAKLNIIAPNEYTLYDYKPNDNYYRYMLCKKESEPEEMTCKINAINGDTLTIDYTMFNYPDCYMHSEYFDLFIPNTVNTVTFNKEGGLKWNNIIFEPRESDITFDIPNDSVVEITGNDLTELPDSAIQIHGNITFNNLKINTIPLKNHHLGNFSANSILFDESLTSYDYIIFLADNRIILDGITSEKCSEHSEFRYYKGSTITNHCLCIYDSDKYHDSYGYNIGDCEPMSNDESNSMSLRIDSEKYTTDNQVYSNEISNNNTKCEIESNITANKCNFTGEIIINGNLHCDTVSFKNHTSVLVKSDKKLIVNTLFTDASEYSTEITIEEGAEIEISNIVVSSTLIINGNCPIINSLTMVGEGSIFSLMIGNYSIKKLMIQNSETTIKGVDNIEIETVEYLEQNVCPFNIETKTLTFLSKTMNIENMTVDGKVTIGEEVKEVNIQKLKVSKNEGIFETTSSNVPLSINVGDINVETDEEIIYLIETKKRNITTPLNDKYLKICDKQYLVHCKEITCESNQYDNKCNELGLSKKICVKKDDTNKYYSSFESESNIDYSCPGESNEYVETELYIEGSDIITYEFKEKEQYNRTFIHSQTKMKMSNKQLMIEELEGNLILDEENESNTIYLNTLTVGKTIERNSITKEGEIIMLNQTDRKCLTSNENGLTITEMNEMKDCCIITNFTTCLLEIIGKEEKEIDKCLEKDKTKHYCTLCEIGHYVKYTNSFTPQTTCEPCGSNCNNCTNEEQCLVCEPGYILNGGKCLSVESEEVGCSYSDGGKCLECKSGRTLDDNRQNCAEECSIDNCEKCDNGKCDICDNREGYYNSTNNVNEEVCDKNTNAKTVTNKGINECSEGYYLQESNCQSCEERLCTKGEEGIKYSNCSDDEYLTNTAICNSNSNSLIESNNKRVNKICSSIVKSKCVCEDGKYFNGEQCVQCSNGCAKCTNDGECEECATNYYMYFDNESEHYKCQTTEVISHCKEYTKGICILCESEYYLNKGECLKCNDNCTECVNNANNCYQCKDGFELYKNECTKRDSHCVLSIGDKTNGKCAICEKGYRRVETTCEKCIDKCETCYESDTCAKCIDDYYYNITIKECRETSEINNCEIIGLFGCEKCEQRYYSEEYKCKKCSEKTEYCNDCNIVNGECQSCEENYVLDVDYKCAHYSEILHCTEAKESKCSKCSFWYKPNDSGKECNSSPVWWLIAVIIIVLLVIFLIIVVLLIIVAWKIIESVKTRKMKKKMREEVTHFKMNKSNIIWLQFGNSKIMVNKRTLDFNFDEQKGEIPVDKETRDVICIGNGYKHKVILRFTTISEIVHKYQIRCNPMEVVLERKEAIEVEVFIEPLCSGFIKEKLQVVMINSKNNKSTTFNIDINAKTTVSNKLDPDELIEEKKIGEGSFGIVFKGKYREEDVAIKKMKNIADNTKMFEEFTKEIEMLGKFRSEYIIYFYGASLIPNRICMVTEFAKHGSLNDLIKQRENPLSFSLRTKIMLDSAKAIQYLHSNGILHRDIKPDNILVISLDEGVNINAKLTDFGSSRNIQLLRSNMTFTRGIGTPVYMAPEILSGNNYSTYADIYSFGVTLFECMSWEYCYPKDQFLHPWDVANFVTSGCRRPRPVDMNNDVYHIICMCWKHEMKERIKIDELVTKIAEIK